MVRHVAQSFRTRRTSALPAGPRLSGLIGSVIARAEDYPDLKSSSHFLKLQEELANTEDRIAAARRFYNGNVRDYRIALQTFPGSLLAGGRTAPEFLKIEFSERLHPLPT